MMKVIRANMQDLESIIPLFDSYRVFYKQSPDIQKVRNFISERLKKGDSIIFLAIDDSDISLPVAGFTQIYHCFSSIAAKEFLLLNDLYVDPDYRNKNVARLLLKTAKKYSIQFDISKIILSTEISNKVAQSLYESEGYEKDNNFLRYILNITDDMNFI